MIQRKTIFSMRNKTNMIKKENEGNKIKINVNVHVNCFQLVKGEIFYFHIHNDLIVRQNYSKLLTLMQINSKMNYGLFSHRLFDNRGWILPRISSVYRVSI